MRVRLVWISNIGIGLWKREWLRYRLRRHRLRGHRHGHAWARRPTGACMRISRFRIRTWVHDGAMCLPSVIVCVQSTLKNSKSDTDMIIMAEMQTTHNILRVVRCGRLGFCGWVFLRHRPFFFQLVFLFLLFVFQF